MSWIPSNTPSSQIAVTERLAKRYKDSNNTTI